MSAVSTPEFHQRREHERKVEYEPHSRHWMVRWLGFGKPPIPHYNGPFGVYENCPIAPPEIQLPGILGMLHDQVGNPLCDWKLKQCSLARYLSWLNEGKVGNEQWLGLMLDLMDWIKPDMLLVQYKEALDEIKTDFPAVVPAENARFSLSGLSGRMPLPTSPRRGNIEPVCETDPEQAEIRLPKLCSNLGKSATTQPSENGGPWRLTAMNGVHMAQEKSRTSAARYRAIQEYRKELEDTRKGDAVMPLPNNWNGPVELSMLDEDMKQTWATLRRHQKLIQQLKRNSTRSNRPMAKLVNDKVEEGRQRTSSLGSDLQFRDYEFSTNDDGEPELRPISPEEASWLWYLCRPPCISRKLPQENEYEGELKVFWNRIRSWLDNRDPSDQLRRGVDFLRTDYLIDHVFNKDIRGPVEKWSLDYIASETWVDAKKRLVLENWGGFHRWSLKDVSYYPEDIIRWPQAQEVTDNNGGIDSWEAYQKSLRQAEDKLPLSAKDLERMARTDQWATPDDEKQTRDFFYRLAYRLGYSIRVLKDKHEQNMTSLKNQSKREANHQSLIKALDVWSNTTSQATIPTKEESQKGHLTRSYRDMVREFVPGEFRQEWEGDLTHEVEAKCAQVISKGIIMELCHNRPYGHVPGNPRGREALWTFGHSSMKPKAKKFWDIERWPLQRQAREQRSIPNPSGLLGVQQSFNIRPDDEIEPHARTRVYSSPDPWQFKNTQLENTGDDQREAGEIRRSTEVEEVERQLARAENGNHGLDGRSSERTTVYDDRQFVWTQEAEEEEELNEQSEKENRVQRNPWPIPVNGTSPNRSDGPMTRCPLQGVTDCPEPGSESGQDLDGQFDQENRDSMGQDQQRRDGTQMEGTRPGQSGEAIKLVRSRRPWTREKAISFSYPNWGARSTGSKKRKRDQEDQISPKTPLRVISES